MTEPIDYEFYRTPAFMTEWLCDSIPLGGGICEPCVGDGALLDVLAALRPTPFFYTNDLDPQWPADRHQDAASPDYWNQFLPGMVDWVVTNPPFSIAAPLLHHAWPRVAQGIILHVRVTFHEPLKKGLRRSLLRGLPPAHVLWLPRVRFRVNPEGKSTTDSTSTCWLVWVKAGPFPHLAANLYPPDSVIDAASHYRPGA